MAQPGERVARDPRFRPYRVAFYVLYFAVAAFLVVATIVSIVRGIWGTHPESGDGIDVEQCLMECRRARGPATGAAPGRALRAAPRSTRRAP